MPTFYRVNKIKSASVILGLVGWLGVISQALALGTPAGTDIENEATVEFTIGASTITQSSNLLIVEVAELIDVDVTVQTATVAVSPGDPNQEILLTVTNLGNGTETFTLILNSALGGDDFDPTPSAPSSIYFDTDSSGDLSGGDTPYNVGVNDPTLAADASIDILIVNDIPLGPSSGDLGFSDLTAESNTGTGAPGDVFAGAGDGGVDAMLGSSGGDDNDQGEYVVTDVTLSLVKTASVSDPFGGTEPVPGAEITYQIVITASGTGTAVDSLFTDEIPTNTTYVAGSLELNGGALTDAPDADEGEFVGSPNRVLVDLGDLTALDGPQTVEFIVTID